jgi:hypothetical protein
VVKQYRPTDGPKGETAFLVFLGAAIVSISVGVAAAVPLALFPEFFANPPTVPFLAPALAFLWLVAFPTVSIICVVIACRAIGKRGLWLLLTLPFSFSGLSLLAAAT